MNKYLRVQMSDGTMFDIPAEVIAEHRAGYFENNSAEKLTYHSSSVKPRLYSAERDYALNNDEILICWAESKMGWKDIEPYARMVSKGINYEAEWPKAKKQVICC